MRFGEGDWQLFRSSRFWQQVTDTDTQSGKLSYSRSSFMEGMPMGGPEAAEIKKETIRHIL